VTKTFGFGPERGGGGTAGPGGGPFGPTPATSRRYNIAISLSARNLLNHTNPGPIIGNITSPLFGQANQMGGGGFGPGTGGPASGSPESDLVDQAAQVMVVTRKTRTTAGSKCRCGSHFNL